MANNPSSLYIHIPFCAHICKYCDFTKLFYSSNLEKTYLESLKKEIESSVTNKVSTLYFGGGTPTALSDEGFESILLFASKYLDKDYEFSVEANVENLTLNKLQIMKKCGVNRLSIGVQSTNDERLRLIGRNHTFNAAKDVIKLAKGQGFDNINIDLIYGFKGETIDDLRKDLDEFIKLDIDHISIYSLIVEQGSMFYNEGYKTQDEDESAKFYEYILNYLRKNGYERYEVSNFARNKKYSRHNLTYWKDKEYYGCGLGASGFVNGIRYTNTRNINTYNSGNYVDFKEEIDLKTRVEDFLLTNLRLEQGFKKSYFKEVTSLDFNCTLNPESIIRFVTSRDLINSNDEVKLTDKGLLRMDLILRELFSDLKI